MFPDDDATLHGDHDAEEHDESAFGDFDGPELTDLDELEDFQPVDDVEIDCSECCEDYDVAHWADDERS